MPINNQPIIGKETGKQSCQASSAASHVELETTRIAGGNAGSADTNAKKDPGFVLHAFCRMDVRVWNPVSALHENCKLSRKTVHSVRSARGASNIDSHVCFDTRIRSNVNYLWRWSVVPWLSRKHQISWSWHRDGFPFDPISLYGTAISCTVWW